MMHSALLRRIKVALTMFLRVEEPPWAGCVDDFAFMCAFRIFLGVSMSGSARQFGIALRLHPSASALTRPTCPGNAVTASAHIRAMTSIEKSRSPEAAPSRADEHAADLLANGYTEVTEAGRLKVGQRVCHAGQQYSDAIWNGTAVIERIFTKAGGKDVELIACRDKPSCLGRWRLKFHGS